MAESKIVFFSLLFLSGRELLPEQLSELQRSQFPGQLWTHPAQLSARTGPEAATAIPLTSEKICREYTTVPSGTYTVPHVAVHLTPALSLSSTGARLGQLQPHAILPGEAAFFSPPGPPDLPTEERRAPPFSAAEEGPVCGEVVGLAVLGEEADFLPETQSGHLSLRLQEGDPTEGPEPAMSARVPE